MNLLPLNADSIPLHKPLPFALRTPSGVLLAHKGFVVTSRAQVEELIARNGGLCIDPSESQAHQRAFMGQLDTLVRESRTLGQIADAQLDGMKQADIAAELQLSLATVQRHIAKAAHCCFFGG